MPQGGEYSISGALVGDQTMPQVSLTPDGGYLVWQDNAIDGQGLGIAARRLDQNFSSAFNVFRVNQQVLYQQERPQVTHLKNGRVLIVWQGGRVGSQSIYLRLLATNGTFVTPTDVRVNTYTNAQQTHPALAALPGGNAVVAWSSLHQDGSMEGIYARIVKTNGTFLTNVFRVNQTTAYNQRHPSVAALTNGNFVVVWISENQGLSALDLSMGKVRADVYGRIYNRLGTALGNEFRINTLTNLCAEPAVCNAGDGGFTVAWAQRDAVVTNSWDVYARCYVADGTAASQPMRVNSYTYGDQYMPRLSRLGERQLLVWASMGQDGSWEGVYGRILAQRQFASAEFRINTRRVSKQIQPAVASDSENRFLVVWASYMGSTSFDLVAQRYALGGQDWPQPAAPFVAALSSSRLSVSWPELAGYPLQYYELYVDDRPDPAVVTANYWIATDFAPGSAHSFQLAYVMAGGERSLKSAPATGRTWGEDLAGSGGGPDGLPDDWQARYWGSQSSQWPAPGVDSDGDGASNWQEFLAGTDPLDPHSVLRTRLVSSPQGRWLEWNTVPGSIYQVQRAANLTTWQDWNGPRFAAGANDSVLLSGEASSGFYRVKRVR